MATVKPEGEDVGQTGRLYVVAALVSPLGTFLVSQRANGSFAPWDGRLETLQSVAGPRPLAATEPLTIVSGLRSLTGQFVIFLGYADGEGVIHFTNDALSFSVQ